MSVPTCYRLLVLVQYVRYAVVSTLTLPPALGLQPEIGRVGDLSVWLHRSPRGAFAPLVVLVWELFCSYKCTTWGKEDLAGCAHRE